MKKNIFFLGILGCMTLLSSCKIIGTIFKAGMWWGIILVVLVLAILGWIFAKMSGKK